jgi:DOPA 4,5-dioxygenase
MQAMPQRPVNSHRAYHAHVYFGPGTVVQARELTDEAGRRFNVAVGRLHEKNVGPHPKWSRQLAFSSEVFDELVPWLEANRGELDILVHALSGDAIEDHTKYAYWLGNDHTLDLSALKE